MPKNASVNNLFAAVHNNEYCFEVCHLRYYAMSIETKSAWNWSIDEIVAVPIVNLWHYET